MHTRKIDLKTIAVDSVITDRACDALDKTTGLECYEIDYEVKWTRGESELIPCPEDVAAECSSTIIAQLIGSGYIPSYREINAIMDSCISDAMHFDEYNWDVIVQQDKLERGLAAEEAKFDAWKEGT